MHSLIIFSHYLKQNENFGKFCKRTLHFVFNRHFSVAPYFTIFPSTETYFGLYFRGAMSAVTGIYLFRLLLNIIFLPWDLFLPKQTVHILMKCRMMAFHQFAGVKNMYRKIYFTIEMQPNIFFKLFLVPYAFTCCNLRVGIFQVSVSNMIIFWRQYLFNLRLMDSGNA